MPTEELKPAPSLEGSGETLSENALEPKFTYAEAPKGSWASDPALDGGITAWLVVLGAWCSLFCTFGWINNIFIEPIFFQHNCLDSLPPNILHGPIVGTLYDRFGPRYLILGGSLIHVFGLMMASISKEYYQVLLSQDVCTIPSWFDKKRGDAYGIVATGSSLGGVIFPSMVSRLIGQIGYGWTMRVAAFLIIFLLPIASLTVRSRVPPRPSTMSKETLLKPFDEFKMLLVILGFLFLTFGVFIPIDYIVVQAMSAGMSPNLAEYLISMLNAASLFGRMSAGISSDKVGHYNVLIGACVLAGILVLALWIPAASNAAIIVFTCTFGFSSGAYVSLANALIVKISPCPEIGHRTGLLFLFSSFGGLTTNPIAGAILQHDGGSYTGMKVFAGLFLLAGSVAVLAARLHYTGPVIKARF
ncbi:hypothetical protein N7478_000858 [Penicillium angulare]|uniref:uncharacterized protein n=1 Tax=Penicillium angulare TaxID=116970 RepID=UPI002541A3C7|nr:uncharacterized protein N7478_000858 [Penicillium angulare]KAJ5291607.1 hypothetical protein N7478_000858 [Penicillium angulare]